MAAPNLVFSAQVAFFVFAATPAALGASDASKLEEGARGWTAAQRDEWALAKNALAGTVADGITVVAATNAGVNAFWIRQGISDPYWAYLTGWAVDPVAGNDDNSGSQAANLPLKTVAELCRRLRWVLPNTNYTAATLNDVPATDLCNPQPRIINLTGQTATAYGSTLAFVGQRTIVRSGTTSGAGTKQTDPSTAAATAQAEVVDAGVAWGADVGRLVVMGDGRQAWVLSAKTNVVGTAGRVTDWVTSAGAFAAANLVYTNQPYNVVTLTKFRAQVHQSPATTPTTIGFNLIFQDLEFDDLGSGNLRPFNGYVSLRFFSAKLSNNNNQGGAGTANLSLTGGMLGGFYGMTSTLIENAGPSLASVSLGLITSVRSSIFLGCGVRRSRITNGFCLSTVSGICIQGGWFQVSSSSGENPAGNCLIGSSGSGLWVGVYADFDLPAASGITDLILVFQTPGCSIQGSVYGVGEVNTAINGLRADVGAQVKIRASLNEPGGGATATTSFNLQPSGAGTQMSLNSAATIMPNLNASATLPLPALAAYTTFAQYKAAPFSRQAVNLNNLSAFIGF